MLTWAIMFSMFPPFYLTSRGPPLRTVSGLFKIVRRFTEWDISHYSRILRPFSGGA
jgi:hypothetical protein